MSKACSRKREREREGSGRESAIIRSYAIEKVPRGRGQPNRCSETFPKSGKFEKSTKLGNRHFQLLQCCSLSLPLLPFPLSLFVIFIWFPPTPVVEKSAYTKTKWRMHWGGVRVGIIANFLPIRLMNFLDFYLLHSFVVVVVSFAPPWSCSWLHLPVPCPIS